MSSTQPELEMSVLEELKSMLGGVAMHELIGVMLNDAPTRVAEFQRGVEQKDLALARRAAHTLKSAAANLGALGFAEFCAEIETAARIGDHAQLLAAQDEMERRSARVTHELMAAREHMVK